MSLATANCLVCGRSYAFNDTTPKHFCSVSCAVDAGQVRSTLEHIQRERVKKIEREEERGQ